MANERPDPDELLRRLAEEEKQAKRGKLTVFFGAAPGVGKTYAMLEVARAELKDERDVLVGVVETHGRTETAALLVGLQVLPRREIGYRGVEVAEFDLDAALARHPALILMDELAHTNAEGSRHPKRWQDVEELLEAGIDVFATMNVQHVESLNDVVAQITGIVVRETVPDSVLDQAHELKLVDLPPDELLERLEQGKVYLPIQAERALENFFRKGNLIALRELALRQTAERVDAQMQAYRRAQGIEQTWAAADQILVAVSPSPFSAPLVRAARRMAAALHAHWYAVYVEPAGVRPISRRNAARLAQNMRLAERLGGEVVTLTGDDASEEILRFSREKNITKIIVGKPIVARLRDRFRTSMVDLLVRRSGNIDVYVTAGDPGEDERLPQTRASAPLHVPSYLAATVAALVATGVAWSIFGRHQLPDVVMTYLLGIMLISSRYGLVPSVFAAFVSVLALDFFFVPPYFTFAVADFSHAVTFLVMFLVAVVISGLTQRVRNQAEAARQREQRTAALYELSRELTTAQTFHRAAEVGAKEIEKVFNSRVAVFTPGPDGKVQALHASEGLGAASERSTSIGQWVWSHQKEAGLGTATLPSSQMLYVPLLGSGGIVGVLGLAPAQKERFDSIEQRRHLDAFASQMAVAMERAVLSEQTEKARREVEVEQLRNSLLSSVSHDLRTPLAIITGAASTLLDGKAAIDEATRQDLTKTVLEEAERLNRLIRNLLDMTRLESGVITINKEWMPLEEVVGAALNRLDARLAGRDVRVELPPGLTLVPFDAVLIEQVLINLLENATKYGQGAIEICAWPAPREVVVEVADHGSGIPAGEEARVFEKFHRLTRAGGGVGLGLSICRAIVTAHGGRIWVENREAGGAAFRFALPLDGEPPQLQLSERNEAPLPEAPSAKAPPVEASR
jgi:two-component system sensor histidine kinase KdpD